MLNSFYREKNVAAVALAKARAAKLTPTRRQEIARNAVKARWDRARQNGKPEAEK